MTKKVDTTPTVFGRTEFFRLAEPEVKKSPIIEAIGASVYAKAMNAADKSSYDFSMMTFKNIGQSGEAPKAEADLTNLKCKYLVRTLCNSKGARLFQDDEANLLGQKKPEFIDAVHAAVIELLGDPVEAEQDLEKNSAGTEQEDLPSDSV